MTAQAGNYKTGDAAFAVNQSGKIVLWNSEAEKLLGYPSGEALGQRCWKLLAGQDIYGNRYCSEFCPIREMALRHESVQLTMVACTPTKKWRAANHWRPSPLAANFRCRLVRWRQEREAFQEWHVVAVKVIINKWVKAGDEDVEDVLMYVIVEGAATAVFVIQAFDF